MMDRAGVHGAWSVAYHTAVVHLYYTHNIQNSSITSSVHNMSIAQLYFVLYHIQLYRVYACTLYSIPQPVQYSELSQTTSFSKDRLEVVANKR